ncbi:MAG TPA: peptidyl-prolyl cis-trans isomerase, partial [Nitrospiria bacterium]|nr:peptidyl-prolyl cis-trans isomerase [Nitrospiria bacterium]
MKNKRQKMTESSPPLSSRKAGLSIRFSWAIFLILLLLYTSCAKKSPPIANIGGEVVSADELEKALAAFGKEAPLPAKPEDLEILKKDLLDQLIQQRLFLQGAKKENIVLPERDIEEFIRRAKADYSEEEFAAMIKSKGLTYASWLAQTRSSLMIQKLEEKMTDGLPEPTAQEIKAYYDSHLEDYRVSEGVKIRQILFKEEQEAEETRKELLKGADFSKLAMEKSISPDKERGGDLGVMTPEQMPDGFEITMTLPIGAISPVIKTPYGFHIFKVEERQKAKIKSLPEEAPKIKTLLAQEKKDQQFAKWARQLRARTEIKIN